MTDSPALEATLSPEELRRERIKIGLGGSALFIVFVAALYFSPLGSGFDWSIIRAATNRLLTGQEIYQVYDWTGIFNPPWMLLLISPIGLLPERLGWAVINALSVVAILMLARRYKLNIGHVILLFLSPPFFYNLIQGHVDVILLLSVFLPAEGLLLAATAKPQLLLPLALRIFHERPYIWLRTFVITAFVVSLSFVFFGFWPLALLRMNQQLTITQLGHNVLHSIWPLQLIVAIPLMLLGLQHKDERYYLAAAPLVSSYASTGSFIGILLAAMTALKWWQAAFMVSAWWIIYFLR